MRESIVIASLMLASFSASAQDTRLVCPERIRLGSGQVAPADVPASATAMVTAAPQLLSSVSVFDGPPSEGAELMPLGAGESGVAGEAGHAAHQRGKAGNAGHRAAEIVWRIEAPSPQGVWLACNYGSQVARIVMKVTGTPTRCEAQMTRGGSPQVLRASLSCGR